jgi:hypothetical protein
MQAVQQHTCDIIIFLISYTVHPCCFLSHFTAFSAHSVTTISFISQNECFAHATSHLSPVIQALTAATTGCSGSGFSTASSNVFSSIRHCTYLVPYCTAYNVSYTLFGEQRRTWLNADVSAQGLTQLAAHCGANGTVLCSLQACSTVHSGCGVDWRKYSFLN